MALAAGVWWRSQAPTRSAPEPDGEVAEAIDRILDERAQALIRLDDELLATHYDTGSSHGRRSLEHEQRRLRYLRAWAEKRRIRLVSASSGMRILSVRQTREGEAWVSLRQSARLGYVYDADSAGREHQFGIGTRHVMQLARVAGKWVLQRDLYTDPLDEDTLIPEVTPADVAASAGLLAPLAQAQALATGSCSPPGDDQLASLGLTEFGDPEPEVDGLAALSRAWQSLAGFPKRFTGMILSAAGPRRQSRYARDDAARYAREYCGAAWGCGNGGRYNEQYKDYTDIGGDCTNFASQVLRAGGLPMDGVWYYRGHGSRAWVQTLGLLDYLLGTGKATLLSRGSFQDVVRATDRFPRGAIGELEPGDLIAYQEKGEVVHFAAVTGRDFRGYTVVNSHTADRNAVPWDVGWDQQTVFWLLEVDG